MASSYKRIDTVLVLAERAPGRLIFAFRPGRMAVLTGAFALGAAIAAWLLADPARNLPSIWAWLAGLLAAALLFSTIVSLTTRRRLTIDAATSTVTHRARSLFGANDWSRTFAEFSEIRLFRPAAGAGAGRAAFVKLLLVAADGEEIPLGTMLFGIPRASTARELATQLAEMTKLSTIEESSVSRTG
jgi:hypothetical protein